MPFVSHASLNFVRKLNIEIWSSDSIIPRLFLVFICTWVAGPFPDAFSNRGIALGLLTDEVVNVGVQCVAELLAGCSILGPSSSKTMVFSFLPDVRVKIGLGF